MKYAIVFVLLAIAARVQAQGTLVFITDLEGDGPFVVTDLNDVANTRVGADWSGQVLAGPQRGTLAAVGNPRPFGINPNTGMPDAALNGIIISSDIVTVNTVSGGAIGWYQLASFQTSFGTYANALANNAVHLTEVVTTQFGGGSPPVPPPNVDGFRTFPVPEPATVALGLVGFGCLVVRRRSRRAHVSFVIRRNGSKVGRGVPSVDCARRWPGRGRLRRLHGSRIGRRI